ncbi:MAG TPA: hypothetical protein VIY49_13245 [Bryobacteraceae bacterium]
MPVGTRLGVGSNVRGVVDTDDNVTAVEITTTPSFKAGTPRVLFKRPGLQSGGIGEGDRFVFLIPVGASH